MIERVQRQIDESSEHLTNRFWELINITKQITDKHIDDHEGKWNLNDQYLKIIEECVEAQKAHSRNLDDKNEEHLDIFFALLTLFHFQNFTRDEIEIAISKCLEKFHERGWFVND